MIAATLPDHVDVLIVGGGPVGALLAQRLAASSLKTLVVEARPAAVDDPRALALSYASTRLLAQAGLWDEAALGATAITQVHVSQQGTAGRMALSAAEIDLPQLGSVVAYGKLAALARHRLAEGKCLLAEQAELTDLHTLHEYAVAHIRQQNTEHAITARLVVLADGGRFAASLPDVQQRVKPYPQHAVLATLTPATPHEHTAWERFADGGPLALLPHGNQLALVWTQAPAQAAARLALDDAGFLAEINAAIGNRAPQMVAVTSRHSYPLALKTVDSVAGQRRVLIGNAAQTLHPVAGQGLNLGLRDADTLAQILLTTPSADLGNAAQLARYARLRRRDAGAMIGFTDGLVALFSRDDLPLKHARSIGLMALDLFGPARRAVARKLVFGGR